VRTDCLASYATSFGGHLASEGLDAVRTERLRSFDAIAVRDENSQAIVREAIGRDVPIVLDPCLQFPIHAAPARHSPREPYVAVYGYRFSEPFSRAVQQWARSHRLPIISIGYRNGWADQNWLTAGPDDFAHFMAAARAVVTNFFHGGVFALRHTLPFVCEMLTDRSIKVQNLMTSVRADQHLMTRESSMAAYDERLSQPLDTVIQCRLDALRVASAAYLESGSAQRQLSAVERREMGDLLFRIGILHSLQKGDHATAVTWFDKVVPLWDGDQGPDEAGRIGESLVSMAISYWQVDRREDALALSRRGVDLMVAAVDKSQLEERSLAVAYGNLSTMYAEEGDDAQSQTYAEMASRAEASGSTLR
jgi:hypothetical protein